MIATDKKRVLCENRRKMKILTIDKNQIVLFSQGILMENIGGIVVYVDEIACDNAINALDNGEIIGLTENNRIISYMQKIDDAYLETEDYPENRVA